MLGTVKFITLEGAKKMAAAGEAEARRNGWNVGQRLAAPGDSSRKYLADNDLWHNSPRWVNYTIRSILPRTCVNCPRNSNNLLLRARRA